MSAGSPDTRTYMCRLPVFPSFIVKICAPLSSYIVYGPLSNGVTTTVFESTPTYPTPARYWQVVEKHKLTQFYTAPTAIRLLRRHGEQHVQGHDLSSLRVIGSVGEPINPEAWNWYNEHVGKRQCAVVDTYWQTETGSIIITPFPGAIETKPGSATVPFFGIDPVILDPQSGKVKLGLVDSCVLSGVLKHEHCRSYLAITWKVYLLCETRGRQLRARSTRITSATWTFT
jgi:acyl-coenzyme A synthetase/AMP-(fatty) acid ligase